MDIVAALIAIVAVVIVLLMLVVVALRVRRSGNAGPAIGAAMAAYDEAMHSTAHNTFVEVQAQRDRTVPRRASRPVITSTFARLFRSCRGRCVRMRRDA
jgi:hypothetical protein